MGRPAYITLAELRSQLPDTAAYPDVVLLGLIEIASDLVELLTEQVFGPTRKTIRVNGWGRRAAAHPKHWKIIEVEQVVARGASVGGFVGPLTPGNGEFVTVERSLYEIHDRCVRLRPSDQRSSTFERALYAIPQRRFSYDDKNVELRVVWGDIDLGYKFETTLAADLNKGDTTVFLTETGDLEQYDTLLIGDAWVIVNSIDVPADPPNNVPGEITIDPSCVRAAAGDAVIRYGQVHRLIRQAVLRTALARRYAPGSEEEQELEAMRRIRREETDNYEREFFAGTTAGRPGGGDFWAGTGDPIADSILSRFRASLVQGRWV